MPVPKHRLFVFMEEVTDEYLQSPINPEAKYWMMRTMGGDYYKEFVEDGYIAIGYNDITKVDLGKLPKNETQSKQMLSLYVNDRYPDRKNKDYPITHLYRFYREMKIGDFVVVPSKNSQYVSFGIITSDIYEVEDRLLHMEGLCTFAKRRTVDWKKSTVKHKLNPSLRLMFNSQHIISRVDDYAPYIDSLLNDFYIKNQEANLVLRINTERDINAGNFFAIYRVFEIVDKFCKENGIQENTADIVMKIQMESPGSVRLSSNHIMILGLVGLAIVGINGGGLKVDAESIGFHLDLSTKGLIGSYSEYLDREVDQGLKNSIRNSLDSLDMSTPQNMEYAIKTFETLNESREKY